MKNGLLILAVAVIAGMLAFLASRSKTSHEADPVLLDSLPELAWLRNDLELSDDQFAKISSLHRAYRPVCIEMCQQIAESEAAVAKLARDHEAGMKDELTQAIENHGRVIAACKRRMLEHLYETASFMNDHQARRYLEVTLPLALDSARGGTNAHCNE